MAIFNKTPDGGAYYQDNTGNDVPAILVDPTVPAIPTARDVTFQEYDNGCVISTWDGTTWTNKLISFCAQSVTVDIADQTCGRRGEILDCLDNPYVLYDKPTPHYGPRSVEYSAGMFTIVDDSDVGVVGETVTWEVVSLTANAIATTAALPNGLAQGATAVIDATADYVDGGAWDSDHDAICFPTYEVVLRYTDCLGATTDITCPVRNTCVPAKYTVSLDAPLQTFNEDWNAIPNGQQTVNTIHPTNGSTVLTTTGNFSAGGVQIIAATPATLQFPCTATNISYTFTIPAGIDLDITSDANINVTVDFGTATITGNGTTAVNIDGTGFVNGITINIAGPASTMNISGTGVGSVGISAINFDSVGCAPATFQTLTGDFDVGGNFQVQDADGNTIVDATFNDPFDWSLTAANTEKCEINKTLFNFKDIIGTNDILDITLTATGDGIVNYIGPTTDPNVVVTGSGTNTANIVYNVPGTPFPYISQDIFEVIGVNYTLTIVDNDENFQPDDIKVECVTPVTVLVEEWYDNDAMFPPHTKCPFDVLNYNEVLYQVQPDCTLCIIREPLKPAVTFYVRNCEDECVEIDLVNDFVLCPVNVTVANREWTVVEVMSGLTSTLTGQSPTYTIQSTVATDITIDLEVTLSNGTIVNALQYTHCFTPCAIANACAEQLPNQFATFVGTAQGTTTTNNQLERSMTLICAGNHTGMANGEIWVPLNSNSSDQMFTFPTFVWPDTETATGCSIREDIRAISGGGIIISDTKLFPDPQVTIAGAIPNQTITFANQAAETNECYDPLGDLYAMRLRVYDLCWNPLADNTTPYWNPNTATVDLSSLDAAIQGCFAVVDGFNVDMDYNCVSVAFTSTIQGAWAWAEDQENTPVQDCLGNDVYTAVMNDNFDATVTLNDTAGCTVQETQLSIGPSVPAPGDNTIVMNFTGPGGMTFTYIGPTDPSVTLIGDGTNNFTFQWTNAGAPYIGLNAPAVSISGTGIFNWLEANNEEHYVSAASITCTSDAHVEVDLSIIHNYNQCNDRSSCQLVSVTTDTTDGNFSNTAAPVTTECVLDLEGMLGPINTDGTFGPEITMQGGTTLLQTTPAHAGDFVIDVVNVATGAIVAQFGAGALLAPGMYPVGTASGLSLPSGDYQLNLTLPSGPQGECSTFTVTGPDLCEDYVSLFYNGDAGTATQTFLGYATTPGTTIDVNIAAFIVADQVRIYDGTVPFPGPLLFDSGAVVGDNQFPGAFVVPGGVTQIDIEVTSSAPMGTNTIYYVVVGCCDTFQCPTIPFRDPFVVLQDADACGGEIAVVGPYVITNLVDSGQEQAPYPVALYNETCFRSNLDIIPANGCSLPIYDVDVVDPGTGSGNFFLNTGCDPQRSNVFGCLSLGIPANYTVNRAGCIVTINGFASAGDFTTLDAFFQAIDAEYVGIYGAIVGPRRVRVTDNEDVPCGSDGQTELVQVNYWTSIASTAGFYTTDATPGLESIVIDFTGLTYNLNPGQCCDDANQADCTTMATRMEATINTIGQTNEREWITSESDPAPPWTGPNANGLSEAVFSYGISNLGVACPVFGPTDYVIEFDENDIENTWRLYRGTDVTSGTLIQEAPNYIPVFVTSQTGGGGDSGCLNYDSTALQGDHNRIIAIYTTDATLGLEFITQDVNYGSCTFDMTAYGGSATHSFTDGNALAAFINATANYAANQVTYIPNYEVFVTQSNNANNTNISMTC